MLKKLMRRLYQQEADLARQAFEQQIAELSAQLETAEQGLSDLQRENMALSTQQEKLLEEMNHLKSLPQEADQKLQLEYRKLEKEKAVIEQKLESLQVDFARKVVKNAELEESHTQLKKSLNQLPELENRLKETERELTELKQYQSFLQGQVQQLQAELENKNQYYERQQAGLIAEKNEELKALQEQVEALQRAQKMSAPVTESLKTPSVPSKSPSGQVATPDSVSARNKKLVLIVDDALTTRVFQKKMLESAGFEVVLGKDGKEGQTMFQQHEPDLVITDIEMPKMDGFQLTDWIRNASDHRNIPVLMVTSYGDDEFQKKGKQAGADDFIQKNNFNQETFLGIVSRYV
jgi:CheY-like chemotaxis protein